MDLSPITMPDTLAASSNTSEMLLKSPGAEKGNTVTTQTDTSHDEWVCGRAVHVISVSHSVSLLILT